MPGSPISFVVLGAGGVGGYYGGLLARAGYPVQLLARGEHLRAIRRDGLRVRTPEWTDTTAVRATDRYQDLDTTDVALLAVKSYHMDGIAPAVRAVAEAGATVVPLLNGVDIAERLHGAGVPPERLLGGLTYISASRTEPGAVERHSPFQKVIVGETAGGVSERVQRIVDAFADAGAEASGADDIDAELWRKFIFLCPLSAACGLARCAVGELLERPHGPLLLERAVREAWAVARARGVALPADTPDRTLDRIRGLPPGLEPSFLLDVLRGGPNEIDILSAAVARLGREHGVDTVVHDTAVAALAAAAIGP